MDGRGVSLVIPAYNEADRIANTITDFLRSFPKLEIIVVDDCSKDGTPEKVEAIRSRRVKLIRLAKRSGKGAAVMEGIKNSRRGVIGFVDADGAFGPNDLKRLAGNLGGYDCVVASKWKGMSFGSVEGSVVKKIFGRFWNSFTRLLLGLTLDDTQAGLKIFRARAIRSIGTGLIGGGFEFDAEILYKLAARGYSINEIFIRPKSVGKSSFSYLKIPSMFANIARMAVILRFFYESGKRGRKNQRQPDQGQ